MKVGLLSYRSHPYSGGQGIYIKHLSKALKNLGHEVSVLSGPPYPELDSEVNLIKIPSLGLFESGERLKAFRLRFLWSPIDLYEWITVMTGGFPEPYTYGKRVLRNSKKIILNWMYYWIISPYLALYWKFKHIIRWQ